jgi:hypothetical protein
MIRTAIVALFAALSLQAAPEPIFNGKDLTGWRVQDGDYWTVKDGILVGESDQEKKNSILWTEKEYTDFVVSAEFRFNGVVDSGFFLRKVNEQIQIGISGSLKRDMTGSPYIGSKGKYPVEAEGVAELLKEGEWNRMKITAKGSVYTVELNGKQVLEYDSETAAEKGPVGLQVHSGMLMKIEFRDVQLEEL